MTTSAAIRRLAPTIAVAALTVVIAACGSTGSLTASDTERVSTSTTTTQPSPTPHEHSEEDSAAHLPATGAHQHDATLPPLATRLAAATADERAATAGLLAEARATLTAFADESDARAAGFVPNDTTKRIIHYRNFANRRDDRWLDPARPEGLVYARDRTGALRLLGALFTSRPGEPAPTPGGAIFSWHTHNESCGSFLVPAGRCTDTFRMLHVWTAPSAVDPWLQSVRQAFDR